jgi:hypothetical protein
MYLRTTVPRDYVVIDGVIQLQSHAQTVCYSPLAQPRPTIKVNTLSSRRRRDQDAAAATMAFQLSMSEAKMTLS